MQALADVQLSPSNIRRVIRSKGGCKKHTHSCVVESPNYVDWNGKNVELLKSRKVIF
jgi:hypothetical protein